MENTPQLCLKWNNFPTSVTSAIENLRNVGDLVDTTLWCEGHCFKAHRVVLSACSNYFKQIFKDLSSSNVAVVLTNIPFQDVDAMLTFMYLGEVSIAESQLHSFLKTAEMLQVKGLRLDHSPPGHNSTSNVVTKCGVPETQFLAAALQRPKPILPHATPPHLSVSSTPSPVIPSVPLLPSIDLSKAISSLSASSHNAVHENLCKKRKMELQTASPQHHAENQRGLLTLEVGVMNPSPSHDHTGNQSQDLLRDSILFEDEHGSRSSSSQSRGGQNRNRASCPHCREDCHNISALKYHVKTVHSEPNGCIYCCYCSAVFLQPAEYKQHAKIEHGVKHT